MSTIEVEVTGMVHGRGAAELPRKGCHVICDSLSRGTSSVFDL